MSAEDPETSRRAAVAQSDAKPEAASASDAGAAMTVRLSAAGTEADPRVAVDPPVRDAATLVLVRRDREHPRVLMGQRGLGAAFMPSKFVFPGGALDAGDHAAPEAAPLGAACLARLAKASAAGLGPVLARAAIRETFEETGLSLGAPHPDARAMAAEAPAAWRPFLEAGLLPSCNRLGFIFRAVTPPFRPRRFDARFFLADAAALADDPDDLSRADGELAHLTWLTLAEARRLDLPLITEVVLAEVEKILEATPPGATPVDRPAPYFHHVEDRSFFDSL